MNAPLKQPLISPDEVKRRRKIVAKADWRAIVKSGVQAILMRRLDFGLMA